MTFSNDTMLTAAIAVTVVAISIGLAVHRSMLKANRLCRRNKIAWNWFAVVSLITLVWSGYYYSLVRSVNEPLSLYLSLEGIIIGLFATYLLTPGRRRVILISKAKNSFTFMIVGGVTERLRQESGWDVQELYPLEVAAESSHGVTEQLGCVVARKADAIVLTAGDVDEHLHRAVLDRLRDGVTVITCDARLDDDYFFGHGVQPPRYVGSNFVQGGREVASYIRQRAVLGDLLFVFCGPAGNRPAIERCRVALYELMLTEHAQNVRPVQIRSFDTTEITNKFQNCVLPLVKNATGTVFVYCGNDENAIIVERCIRLVRSTVNVQFRLVGYDGVRDSRSVLMVDAFENIVATVDTLPHRLGQSAADLLLAVQARSVESNRKSIVINPTLWERT